MGVQGVNKEVRQETAVIMEISRPGEDLYHLVLHAPRIAEESQAGQFVMIRCAPERALDPLLSRPFSIFRFHPANGIIEILFRLAGRGTAWLAGRKKGDALSLFGPLGRGFSPPGEGRRVLLFAGGIGMPALFSLAENHPETDFTLFYGARKKDELLYLDLWRRKGVTVYPATDDGSAGFHGTVTAAAAASPAVKEAAFYYACGPRPMLKAVKELMEKQNIPGELCLEETMACGVGACLGCVCATVHGYRRVCTDGPVFAAAEVKFP